MADFMRVKKRDKEIIKKVTGDADRKWHTKRIRSNCAKLIKK